MSCDVSAEAPCVPFHKPFPRKRASARRLCRNLLSCRISGGRLVAALRRGARCCAVCSSLSPVVTPNVVMAERVAGRHLDWDDPSWLVCACSCCRVVTSLGNPGCCQRPAGQIWMARGLSAVGRCGMSQQVNCGGIRGCAWERESRFLAGPLWFPGAWFPLMVRSIAGRVIVCRTRSTG
jgi:hypothetical protein